MDLEGNINNECCWKSASTLSALRLPGTNLFPIDWRRPAICHAAAPPFEFVCHDRDGIAWGTVECLQDRVPHIRLILLVSLSAGTMDGKNADIVSSEAPNSKCMVSSAPKSMTTLVEEGV
jgi:hypothetical protein